MIVWSFSSILASRRPTTHNLFARPILTLYWSIGGMSNFSVFVRTNSGSFMNSFAASIISCGKVAENRRVCSLFVILSMTHMISGKNPISSILSASSKTKKVGFSRLMKPLSVMSMTLPGVPTMMSTPACKFFACFSKSVPP